MPKWVHRHLDVPVTRELLSFGQRRPITEQFGDVSARPLVRPVNGDAQGLQRFEPEIGRILAAALRDTGPLR